MLKIQENERARGRERAPAYLAEMKFRCGRLVFWLRLLPLRLTMPLFFNLFSFERLISTRENQKFILSLCFSVCVRLWLEMFMKNKRNPTTATHSLYLHTSCSNIFLLFFSLFYNGYKFLFSCKMTHTYRSDLVFASP